MSWKSVVKQCRFDCVGTGLFNVANMVFLLVFPVLSIVVSLVMISTHVDEHVASGLMGGLGGLASVMACMSALGPAASEESAGHSAMRGLIPVSRTAQVVGRYLFLLVVGLLWALDVVICGGIFIVFGDIADMGWIGALASGASIFALAIILGSVLLACAYRFTFRKMMMAFGAVMVGLYAVIALLARLPRLAMAIAEYCRFPDDLVAYGACSRRVVSARIFWLHAYSHPHLPSQRTLAAHLSDHE